MFKNYFYSFLIIIGFIFVFNFFYTIIDYFFNISSFFRVFILIISLFIGGIFMGNKSLKKGYLEGLKIGILFSLFVIILSIIFGTISLYSIFIIFICILSSILGAMIGINKKTDSLE